jgi:beta-lactamase superfamily II metal-dependent hydrolase
MKVKFWRVGTGDAISITFFDESGLRRNIFIDSGFVGTYAHTIKPELIAIQKAGEVVDLWVLTHTDRDHIGGVITFIKDGTFEGRNELVKEYWFNWSDFSFQPTSDKLSVAQGINLRDYLRMTGKLNSKDIKSGNVPVVLYGCEFTILSPNAKSLENSKVRWQREEVTTPIATPVYDYDQTIEDLTAQSEIEDADPFNGGSVAFLLQYQGHKLLFLGDSHPTVVVESLRNLGYSPTNRLQVEFVKLSHHASMRNTSRELLSLIESSNYIILAEGRSHALPNKWTLANILTNSLRDRTKPVFFYFNHETPRLRSIFEVDGDTTAYNFSCVFGKERYLEFTFP